ncbi:MAG: hypothetical protein KAV42_09010 [Candidatus Krumholzibacteria bacterium]|nr:hypothetical protein [Candidatus Krumholzibacteria bacterium]
MKFFRHPWFALASAVAILTLFSRQACSRTWYVDACGGGDMPTIQAAIDTSSPGDEILVGPGNYSWSTQGGEEAGMITFWDRDMYITVRSEMGPEVTILDAEFQSRVIYCHGQNWITIDGFTITRGEAPDFGDRVGGGFFTHIPGETVKNCIFTNNRAEHGGAISCVINDRFFSAENCLFIGNEASRYGGAISLWNGTSTINISGCVFDGNIAGEGGGGLIAYNCPVEVNSCTFYDNTSADRGAVIHVHTNGNVQLRENTICENSTSGPVFSSTSTAYLLIERTVVAFNRGYLFDLSASTTGGVGCSNFYGNNSGDALPVELTDNDRNIFVDPLFCGSPGSHNYFLRSDSPCFPANRPDGLWCSVIGAWPIDCGDTATEKESWGSIKNLNK